LLFDGKESKRKPLSAAKGELKAIKQFLNIPLDPETVWYNPYFKERKRVLKRIPSTIISTNRKTPISAFTIMWRVKKINLKKMAIIMA
jgi:hypothetical protein